jgi:ATP-dependent DNA helicase DinG
MDSARLTELGLAAFDFAVGAIPGFRQRPGQRQMAEQVAQAFAKATLGEVSDTPDRSVAVIQAGTGVGKSAAYTLPGIAIAKERKCRLVLSTGTVALQEQLVSKDLPMLAAAMKEPFTFAMAKGRGRFLCKLKLASRLGGGEVGSLAFDDDDEAGSKQGEPASSETRVTFFRSLSDALNSGWNGDKDSLPEQPDTASWAAVAADRHTCTVKACPHFSSCSYYVARRDLARADVIVANHDLVLSSIGTRNLPELSDALWVFDEGHNLPQTAVDQFAAKLDLTWLRWLDKLPRAYRTVGSNVAHHFGANVERVAAELKSALQDLGRIIWDLYGSSMKGKDGAVRFAKGCLPDVLAEPIRLIRSHAGILEGEGQALSAALRLRMQEAPELNAQWASLFALLGSFGPRVGGIAQATDMLLTDGDDAQRLAKWISADDAAGHVSLRLNACPILPGDLLATQLWHAVRGAVVTSATLTSCGRFDYFLAEAGLDTDPAAAARAVPSPFDYAMQGELIVQRTKAQPKSLADFNAEVSLLLARQVEVIKAGALALFTSRKHMEATYDVVHEDMRGRILMQGALSRTRLLQEHRRRVEAGQPSVIFGLQSFGEGLDLPGELCAQLFITKMPFAPPTDPVWEARAEYVDDRGGSSFDQLVVPATGVRLLQWTGRGIRTETDRVKITCYDSRLTQREYGRRILRGLPPYPVRQLPESNMQAPGFV